jgi:hypothetical protein
LKNIVPSSNISPAASAVVARFYKKYKGTPVVVENITKSKDADKQPWIHAGYIWSSEITGIDIPVVEIKDPEEGSDLVDTHSLGFGAMYSDNDKTKLKDFVFLLKAERFTDLHIAIQEAIDDPTKRRTVFPWLVKYHNYLEQIGKLDEIKRTIQNGVKHHNMTVQQLYNESFPR